MYLLNNIKYTKVLNVDDLTTMLNKHDISIIRHKYLNYNLHDVELNIKEKVVNNNINNKIKSILSDELDEINISDIILKYSTDDDELKQNIFSFINSLFVEVFTKTNMNYFKFSMLMKHNYDIKELFLILGFFDFINMELNNNILELYYIRTGLDDMIYQDYKYSNSHTLFKLRINITSGFCKIIRLDNSFYLNNNVDCNFTYSFNLTKLRIMVLNKLIKTYKLRHNKFI